MENQSVVDTRNFLENQIRAENQRRHMADLRRFLEQKTHSINYIIDAVRYGHDKYTKRFFVHATLFISFKNPVKEINDFYQLLRKQIDDYGYIPEWKPFVLYVLSKLMCDLHQVQGHNEMRKFRASMRREIMIDMRYKTIYPYFVYNYESTLPTDDDGHFQYANIFFDESPCDEENVQYKGLEFEEISVLNRHISYKRHLEQFGLIDGCFYGYPMPICTEFLDIERGMNE